ncbi:hypothetical protein CM240_1598 [Clostridium bornimense]|uniref:Cell division protein SepF n=1 Tax=Clostridium bornimense TaxID=1216932 RepID=W6RVN0_9CLOT|nr:cell division protein SepF [Clostridium bornimense]CDM68756.1 hypothetical protein CM240_1598 [Clostridium bornimense]
MFNKFKEIIGLEDEEDFIEEMEENREKEEEVNSLERETIFNTKKSNSYGENKLVNIHTSASVKVVISKPNNYDEATAICDDLRNRRIVVVNTSNLETKVAQRLLDFISGACYAVNGEIQEVEKGVYVLSPSNVEVSKEIGKSFASKRGFLDSEE